MDSESTVKRSRKIRIYLRGCLKSRTGCKKALSVYAVNR
jgi:hypothetical protein